MMKKLVLFSVLLLSFSFAIMAESVTGDTGGLNSTLLSNLRRFASNTGRNLNIRSGYRTESQGQSEWDAGLARGGHISSDHNAAVRNGSDCPYHDLTGGNAVHAPQRYGSGWMQIARPTLSRHATGDAADVDGITWSDCAELNRAGLRHTVRDEPWHVEVGTSCSH